MTDTVNPGVEDPRKKQPRSSSSAADRLLFESIESGPLPPPPPRPKPAEPTQETPHAEPNAPAPGGRPKPAWAQDKEERKPSIRTMKSDAQELMAVSKPSFSNLVAQEVAESQRREKENPVAPAVQKDIWLRIVAVVALIFLLSGASFYLFSYRGSSVRTEESARAGGAFFATEHTLGVAASSSDPAAFKERLGVLQNVRDREGTFTHILVTHYNDASTVRRPITFDDILALLGARPPITLGTQTGEPAMIFLMHKRTNSALGIAARIGEPERTFGALLAWERGRLVADLSPILPQSARGTPLNEFQDRTYRNIDWRAAIAVAGGDEIGIHYGVYGAKNILLVANSREAMERTIDRLYDAP